jgi:hypothetical protein
LHPGDEGRDVLAKALGALSRAYWVDKRKTFERDVLVEVLAETFGKEEAEKGMLLVASSCFSLQSVRVRSVRGLVVGGIGAGD